MDWTSAAPWLRPMPSIPKKRRPLTWSRTNKPTTSWSSKTINPSSLINSPSFPWPRAAFFPPPDITLDQAHGRHETRGVYPFEITPESSGFPYALQAAVVIRTTHHLKSVRVTEEMEMLISSRPTDKMNAAQIQAFRRGHWSIEILHYVRDVTFGEDHSTVHTKHASRNMATLRHLVIGLCGIDGARRTKRHSSLP